MATTQFLSTQLDSLIQAATNGGISAQHRLGDYYDFCFYDDKNLVASDSTELEGA